MLIQMSYPFRITSTALLCGWLRKTLRSNQFINRGWLECIPNTAADFNESLFLQKATGQPCLTPKWRLAVVLSAAVLLQACGSRPVEKHPAQIFFEQQCQHAGPKIHRRVDNVEGIMLLRLRPREGDAGWSDKDFEGAALALEARGDEYIMKFLAYEHSFARQTPVSPQSRGYITTDFQADNISNVRGYRYVEAIDPADGFRYRYTFHREPLPGSKIGSTRAVLDKRRSQGEAPRYGVTFEYLSTPQARAFGVASVKVQAVDTRTGEVLGEYVQHVKGVGFNRADASMSSPWLNADRCPFRTGDLHGLVRQFVDTVVVPIKEERR